MLTSTTAALLAVLDETAGFTTGQISRHGKFGYCSDNNRQRSGAVRAWLIGLRRQGLVDFLDDQKPVCWKLTPAGTTALERYKQQKSATT